MDTENLPLPAYAHLPGINRRHGDNLLESIAAKACPATSDLHARHNIAWRYGIRLVNTGFNWEAHEVLEAVWRNAAPNSRERFLVQCLIHIANARLKLLLDQPRAATRLADLAAQCLLRACPQSRAILMGLESSELHEIVTHCAEAGYLVKITQKYAIYK